MLREQARQIYRGVGQSADREGDIFDHDRGAAGAYRADGGKHALANIPQAFLFQRVVGKSRLVAAIETGNGGLGLGRIFSYRGFIDIRRLEFDQ